jgi:hypothetical protein
VRKVLLLVAIVAALAGASVAGATTTPPSPHVACGPTCNGGSSGWTGCTQQRANHSASVAFLVSINHYVVVNYCKVNGIITSLSIAAHGCDVNGLISCSPGPAWVSGGGVGSGWATIEAHALWVVWTAPISNTDVLTLTISPG